MSDPDARPSENSENLAEILGDLDRRLTRIENNLGLGPSLEVPAQQPQEIPAEPSPGTVAVEMDSLEQRIGEFGFAWIGTLVVLLGVLFGVSYLYGAGLPKLALSVGYATAMALYMLSRSWRQSFPYKARLMIYSSGLVLYYTTVRLHFLTDDPLVGSRVIALLALVIVVGFLLFQGLRRDSGRVTGIALLLGLVTALLADTLHVSLSIVVLVASIAVLLDMRRNWWGVLITMVLGSYMALLIWQVGNPLMGHPLDPLSQSPTGLIYVLLCASIFSWPTLFFDKYSSEEIPSVGLILFNVLGASFLVTLIAISHYGDSFAPIYAALAGVLILLSAFQWTRTHAQMAPAWYACFGFLSLSIAFYGFLGIPNAYFWLAIQSLLVVSMALWFRSRLLVVANSFIYAIILLAYLVSSPQADLVNFGFAVVALGSARIMNWQKERLTLRTEMLRNAYLIIALIFVAYALFGAVPRQFVTLAWAAAAASYFGLSILLSNVKYRWMGIATLLGTVVYLFLVDLARLGPGFRVLSFLGLGGVAVLISLFYTRFKKFLTRV
jgi:uncharacterized membrane protein